MSDLDPAKSVIEKCGGVAAVAKICARHTSSVQRWMYPKSKRGTGGLIPAPEAVKILRHAKKSRLKIKPSDFFPKVDG